MIIRNRTPFVYDIEVFPNFFSCAIKNTISENIVVYEVSSRKNDLPAIFKLFRNKNIIFVTYNGIHYDNPIISYILLNYRNLICCPTWMINRELKDFSDLIINSETSKKWAKYKYANLFQGLDLLTMMFSSKNRCGLKELQVTMQYKNVREYEGNFNVQLPTTEFDNVISYNINDVESTHELMNRLEKDIQLRLDIEKELGVDVLNLDSVNLGVEIIKNSYLKDTGKKWDDIKDLRTSCHSIDLKDILFDFIEFKRKEFKELHSELLKTIIDLDKEKDPRNKDKFRKIVNIGDLEITYSMGGIHTKSSPKIYKTDEDWVIIDSDCQSMYPTGLINFSLYPNHLGPEFLNTYKKIREDRIKAKLEGNKVVNLTYKLALNGISGMLQSEFSWCYDPKTVLTLRLNCQLMLLMLTERLLDAGCIIGQLNTDGILYLAPRNKLEEIFEICKEWENITKFTLEHEYFESFYQYDVNNYIGVYKGYSETHDPDLIKTKGLFVTKPSLGKGMSPMIIAEALVEYFVNSVSVNDTLDNCKDIRKFLTYQKVNKTFKVEYKGEIISHINRYYMSINGSKLRKCVIDYDGSRKKYTDLCATSGVTLFNELIDIDPKDANINYAWYRNEIYKIIYAIEDSLNPTLF